MRVSRLSQETAGPQIYLLQRNQHRAAGQLYRGSEGTGREPEVNISCVFLREADEQPGRGGLLEGMSYLRKTNEASTSATPPVHPRNPN